MFLFSFHWYFIADRQRLQIIQLYYENQRPVKSVFRTLRTIYGQHNRPNKPTIWHTINKIENYFTLLDNTRSNRPRSARNAENIAAVAEGFHDDLEESIRHRSRQLGLSYGTTWEILRRSFSLKAYKIELVQ